MLGKKGSRVTFQKKEGKKIKVMLGCIGNKCGFNRVRLQKEWGDDKEKYS